MQTRTDRFIATVPTCTHLNNNNGYTWFAHFVWYVLYEVPTDVDIVHTHADCLCIKLASDAQVFQNVGANKKLGLSGRPSRPIGALGTSKVNSTVQPKK